MFRIRLVRLTAGALHKFGDTLGLQYDVRVESVRTGKIVGLLTLDATEWLNFLRIAEHERLEIIYDVSPTPADEAASR